MTSSEPPASDAGSPTEPFRPVAARAPHPPEPERYASGPPGGEPVGPGPGGPPWWQNELAIVGVGLVMLLAGGALGYVLGHSNARTRTQYIGTNAPRSQTQTRTQTSSTTVTRSTTHRPPAKVVTHLKTVTVPARTVTTHAPTRTVTAPAATHVVTHTATRTVTSTTTVTATSSTTSSSATGATQSFTGSGTQNLGTIHVANASVLRWSCSGCGTGTFSLTSSSSDQTPLHVQGQNATSGQANVAAGTYTSVTGQGNGAWSFTIGPASGST